MVVVVSVWKLQCLQIVQPSMLLLRLLLSVMAMVEYRFFFCHSENPSRLDSFIMEMQMFSYVPADNTTTTICARSSCCSVLWQWWHTGFFFTLNFFQRLESFMERPNAPGCLSIPFHSDCFLYCSFSFYQSFRCCDVIQELDNYNSVHVSFSSSLIWLCWFMSIASYTMGLLWFFWHFNPFWVLRSSRDSSQKHEWFHLEAC